MKKEFRPKRIMVPFRLNKLDYDRGKVKLAEDHLSFQRVMEALYVSYLNGNKRTMEILRKFQSPVNDKRRRYDLNELETNELRILLETEISPLKHLSEIAKSIENEKDDE